MALTLKLREEDGGLVVTFADQTVKTALEKLPAIASLQADPFTNGQVLTAALGGVEMLQRLADDPDNLILLDCDDTADAFAWEFATLRDRQFLCVKAGMLRTVDKTSEVLKTSEVSQLNFIALAADPLVDEHFKPRNGYRLDLDNEMRSIRETLEKSGKKISAFRIPPTRNALIDSLMEGSAILHLSCHGNVVPTKDGPVAVLDLETEDGTLDPLLGGDLLSVASSGALRFVLLSACYTATGTQANLARALALSGVPITVGMQNPFPDPLSDDLAVKLYRGLLAGLKIGEALRLTRVALARDFHSVGLPVGYVSANGWSEAFPIGEGTPSVGGLGKPGEVALGGEIQPPRPLLGRNLELHQIAKLFSLGRRVITVAGTGGMGKTALAAAFAERFAWLWPRGVRAYSFANEVNVANFRYALMRALFGAEQAQQGAGLNEAQQREDILNAAREWNGLWLFDNYESVLDEKDKNADAESIHRLIYDLANGGAAL
ncbi:MAG: CHAT domain-containing protein, partial [Chloroflexota bacterium]